MKAVAGLLLGAIIVSAAFAKSDDARSRNAALDDLARGRVALTCTILRSHRFIFHQVSIRAMFADERWEDLGATIVEAGWRQDIAYFLLGVSAENLGHVRAADRYFRIAGALSNTMGYQCAAVNDLCGQVNVASEAAQHLTAIDEAVRALVAAMPATATNGPAAGSLIAYGFSRPAPASGKTEQIEESFCQSFGRPLLDANRRAILWTVCGDPTQVRGLE